jgi:hypothetical protein
MAEHIFIGLLAIILFMIIGDYTQQKLCHKPLFKKAELLLIKRIGWILAVAWLIAVYFKI